MIAVVRRLASLRRFAPLALALAASMGGCAPRALLELDVTSSDTPFQSVTLRLDAGGTSKDFANASFSAAMTYKAGMYVDASGSINVVANVLDSSGKCIGAGTASLTGIVAGSASGATPLMVMHTTACSSVSAGTGGSAGGTGGATGAGGSGDNGSGGNGNGAGGSGNGSGGSSGGMGGMTGSGGQSGGTNLIMNGDFSNGSNGWGLPAMLGQVNQTVTNGQFCVTVQAGSATIGYPSGGVPPFQINGGASYTFSYQASSTGNLTIESKIGQVQTPYDATGSDFMNEQLNSSLQPISHTFTRGSTDSMMGVAFNLTGGPGTFCVDNVSVTAN